MPRINIIMDILRTSPPAFDLVSSDELVEWLRIDPNTDADTLKMLVTSATEYVEGLTNLTIGASTYRIRLDHRATRYRLPLTNVTGITGVTVSGQPLTDGYRLDGCSVVFYVMPDACPVITVMAGYGSVETVPDAIRHSIAVLVSAGYNSREEIDPKTFATVERLCSRYRRYSL